MPPTLGIRIDNDTQRVRWVRVGVQELRRRRAVGHRGTGVRVFGSHDERVARTWRQDCWGGWVWRHVMFSSCCVTSRRITSRVTVDLTHEWNSERESCGLVEDVAVGDIQHTTPPGLISKASKAWWDYSTANTNEWLVALAWKDQSRRQSTTKYVSSGVLPVGTPCKCRFRSRGPRVISCPLRHLFLLLKQIFLFLFTWVIYTSLYIFHVNTWVMDFYLYIS